MPYVPEEGRPETALDHLTIAARAAGVDVDEMLARAAAPDVVPPDEFEADRQEIAAARRAARGVECCECGATISGSDRNVLREIAGWSALREQGGQNHVIGRKVTGRLMCGECAVRMRAGLAPAQETLPL